MNDIKSETVEKLLPLARHRLSLFMQLQEELSKLCEKTTIEEIDDIRALTDRQHALTAEIDCINRDFFEILGGPGLDEKFLPSVDARAETVSGSISCSLEELRDVIGRQKEVLHACKLLNEDAIRHENELQASVKEKLSQIRQQKIILANYCSSDKSRSGVLFDIRVKQFCRS